MPNYKLISILSGKEVDEKVSVTIDPKTGGPLEVVYDYQQIKKQINPYVFESTPISSRKYLDLYPIRDYGNVITLHEGHTPLYKSRRLDKELGIEKLFFKYEGTNPTGSFKDRGSLVEVTKAIELGAKAIILASTGNMAASVATFSAKAGINCYILIPAGTAASKLAQSLSAGAKVIQVHGDYQIAAELAAKVAKKYGFFLAGDYSFRQEGQKSAGYEIIEQLLFRVPDYVIVPVGVGTNITAIWKAFNEYKILGFIDKLPHMIAVQAAGVSPIIKSFNLNLSKFEAVKNPQTVSGAIAVGNPFNAIKVIDLLKKSHGLAVEVTDEDTLECQHELARKESVFVEPASATTIAALKKLKKQGKLKKNATYVCLLTGHGLKDPDSALKILAEPPTIEPTLQEIDKILSSPLLQVQSYGAKKRSEVIFQNKPSRKQLKTIIKKQIQINVDEQYLTEIQKRIVAFLAKGKKVSRADLQYIIENTIQTYLPVNKQVLQMLDFEITTKFGQPAKAKIIVKTNGSSVTSIAVGTGPVDAAINALLKVCQKNGASDIKLTDYQVEINTQGTNAAVDVEMKLENKKGKILGQGTSPDIIQASIEAFVSGYNLLMVKD